MTLKVALMGLGLIGRGLLFKGGASCQDLSFVALGDSSGFVVKPEGFDLKELLWIIAHKKSGGALENAGSWPFFKEPEIEDVLNQSGAEVLVDATAAQTYQTLWKALETSHVVTCNKLPLAETPYKDYLRLMERCRELGRCIRLGATVGAGLRLPTILAGLGANDIQSLVGCLSGTMNYVSQRINEDTPFSQAIHEAMSPPRNYAEPDPRADITGADFKRKLVILIRLLGLEVDTGDVETLPLLPEQYLDMGLQEFLDSLHELDSPLEAKVREAKDRGRALWFLGRADIPNEEYSLGLQEIPLGDPLAQCRESDNSLQIKPHLWRRPVTITGPGAGVAETVSGLLSDLLTIPRCKQG